jgi:hypothetical protein
VLPFSRKKIEGAVTRFNKIANTVKTVQIELSAFLSYRKAQKKI